MFPRECKITVVKGKYSDIVVAPRGVWLGETVEVCVEDGIQWIKDHCQRAPIVLIDPAAGRGEQVRELDWDAFIGDDE